MKCQHLAMLFACGTLNLSTVTSKVIAARFLQVEAVLQGAGDVVIGSSIPLMEK